MDQAAAEALAVDMTAGQHQNWKAMTRDAFFGRPSTPASVWGVALHGRWYDHDPRPEWRTS